MDAGLITSISYEMIYMSCMTIASFYVLYGLLVLSSIFKKLSLGLASNFAYSLTNHLVSSSMWLGSRSWWDNFCYNSFLEGSNTYVFKDFKYIGQLVWGKCQIKQSNLCFALSLLYITVTNSCSSSWCLLIIMSLLVNHGWNLISVLTWLGPFFYFLQAWTWLLIVFFFFGVVLLNKC